MKKILADNNIVNKKNILVMTSSLLATNLFKKKSKKKKGKIKTFIKTKNNIDRIYDVVSMYSAKKTVEDKKEDFEIEQATIIEI